MKIFYLSFALYLITGQNLLLLSQTNIGLNTVEENVCPFEGCQYGQWIIKDTIKVYETEGDTNSIKYWLTNNDTITALTGNIHYEKFGKILITTTFDNFTANDTLTVLRCTEGEFTAFYKNKRIYVDVFWPMKYYEADNATDQYGNKKYKGIMIERPQMVWWVKIVKNGAGGWLRLKNINPYCFDIKEKIDGMDSME